MNKEEQQKALYDYQKESLEYNKRFKKKWLKRITIILSIYGVLLLFIWYIGDYMYLPLPNHADKYYEIKLNEGEFLVSVNRDEFIPIIPFVMYWDRTKRYSSIPNEDKLKQTISADSYILSINVYSCLDCETLNRQFNNQQVSFPIKNMQIYKYKFYNQDEDYEKILNTKEYSEEILYKKRALMPKDLYKVVYDGKFISNITSFIGDNGLYGIKIVSNKNKVTLTFGLIKKGDKVILI